jgi:hypothetical protein
MRGRSLVASLLVALVCACSSDGSQLTAPQAAHDVSIRVTAPGRCIFATCTPEPDGGTTLGLIEITNSGTADAFLQACGSGVALGQSVLLNGQWTFVGPAVSCAAPSTPIRIAAGQTLQYNEFFAPGWRRMGVDVSVNGSTLGDSAAVSNIFHIL